MFDYLLSRLLLMIQCLHLPYTLVVSDVLNVTTTCNCWCLQIIEVYYTSTMEVPGTFHFIAFLKPFTMWQVRTIVRHSTSNNPPFSIFGI